jgi:hypothetical protein
MARNLLQVYLKDADPQVDMLAAFLREGEISSRAIEALSAFYMSLAVAANPDSTKADIRKAEHECLSKLKAHMCFLMDKHYREDDIRIDPNEFSNVIINSLFKGYDDQASTRSGKSSALTSQFSREVADIDRSLEETKPEAFDAKSLIAHAGTLSNENPSPDLPEATGQRLSRENQERSDEIDRSINSSPVSQPELNEDDDYDPDDDLSDEEWLAKQEATVKTTIAVFVD